MMHPVSTTPDCAPFMAARWGITPTVPDLLHPTVWACACVATFIVGVAMLFLVSGGHVSPLLPVWAVGMFTIWFRA